jgi:hypothetical protein
VARVTSGVFSLGFIALAGAAWHDASGGKYSLDSLFNVPVLLCVAGSGLCVLVAVGRLGRHKRGWI